MNPDLTPNHREYIESRVTALLLGELSAQEAESLRELIAQDAELRQMHDRLKQTLDLLRESVATEARESATQPAPLKLSDARRQALLAHFKTIKELAPQRRSRMPSLVQLAAAAAIVILAAVLAVPNFQRARTSSQKESIVNNLRLIDSGKQQWALEHSKQSTDTPTLSDLQPYLGHGSSDELLSSVRGETYNFGPVGMKPVAELPGSKDKRKIVSLEGEEMSAKDYYKSATQPDSGALAGAPEPATAAPAPLAPPSTLSSPPVAVVLPQPVDMPTASPPPPMAAPSAPPPPAGSSGLDFSRNEQSVPAARRSRELGLSDRLVTRNSFGGGGIAGASAISTGTISGELDKNGPLSQPTQESFNEDAITNSIALDYQIKKAQISDNLQLADASVTTRGGNGNFALSQSLATSTFDNSGTLKDAKAKKSADTEKQPRMGGANRVIETDASLPKLKLPPPIPQPEIETRDNNFSTFSLNISDVSFKLAAASLENGTMPDAASIRSEEFINAFDYRDPQPAPGAPIGFSCERAGYPFAHNRDLLRFSIKTAAEGRQAGRPLNLVLLLDKSGSMERADRVEIVHQALGVLASELQAQDTLSVVVFARTARLWVDGVPGSKAHEVADGLSRLTPEGGTDLEEGMKLAYGTALHHYLTNGDNRVVLLTDGAANLGNVSPDTLKQQVEQHRKQGIALDCFGIGWEDYNDDMLETLSRNGDGRYGFINTPGEAATEFAGKLAGALRVAASDVKVQVEFNTNRVTSYRQIGYAKHQLTKEQFRDNRVNAAQIGAAESGNALYTVEVNPAGEGPLCTVRVRYRTPGTSDYHEHEWAVPYNGAAVSLENASPAMRLAAVSSAFSEWLASSPYAAEVTPDRLLGYLHGVPEVYGADARPKKLEWMVRQAKSFTGR